MNNEIAAKFGLKQGAPWDEPTGSVLHTRAAARRELLQDFDGIEGSPIHQALMEQIARQMREMQEAYLRNGYGLVNPQIEHTHTDNENMHFRITVNIPNL